MQGQAFHGRYLSVWPWVEIPSKNGTHLPGLASQIMTYFWRKTQSGTKRTDVCVLFVRPPIFGEPFWGTSFLRAPFWGVPNFATNRISDNQRVSSFFELGRFSRTRLHLSTGSPFWGQDYGPKQETHSSKRRFAGGN